jgi:hypothetical protein
MKMPGATTMRWIKWGILILAVLFLASGVVYQCSGPTRPPVKKESVTELKTELSNMGEALKNLKELNAGLKEDFGALHTEKENFKAKLEVCEGKAEAIAKRQKEAREAAAKKSRQNVVKQQVARQVAVALAPVSAPVRQVAVPNYAAPKLILRINVVEWSEDFRGKSLLSRDIGPVVRQGLANGTVVRTKSSCGFIVNGASVVVNDGNAIVDPGPISPETVLVVQPASGSKFASPPGSLPLTTNPGELDAVVKQGVSEIWMNFILAPPTG